MEVLESQCMMCGNARVVLDHLDAQSLPFPYPFSFYIHKKTSIFLFVRLKNRLLCIHTLEGKLLDSEMIDSEIQNVLHMSYRKVNASFRVP